ncbi:hypothetical protein ACFY2R_23320 [Micromonospora olivasterospora]|uniref:Uncharacterized protein n=1 Tax=Micromonospora olivasterospora TaxID=1880 RepID=A0A562ICQ1_MICOL|nr:hypothetical protein [Micromonospora olivasterospora]TWH68493.1 hypothetical protein JD77_03486 [Micromonospora olivasterospora]
MRYRDLSYWLSSLDERLTPRPPLPGAADADAPPTPTLRRRSADRAERRTGRPSRRAALFARYLSH